MNVFTSLKVIEPGSLETKSDDSANILGFSDEEGMMKKGETVGTESNLVEFEDKKLLGVRGKEFVAFTEGLGLKLSLSVGNIEVNTVKCSSEDIEN